jgi:hypothetical protein
MLFVIIKGFTAILFAKRKKKAGAKESSRWGLSPSRVNEVSEARQAEKTEAEIKNV